MSMARTNSRPHSPRGISQELSPLSPRSPTEWLSEGAAEQASRFGESKPRMFKAVQDWAIPLNADMRSSPSANCEAMVDGEVLRPTQADVFTPAQKSMLYSDFGVWEKGFTVGFLKVACDFLFVLRFPQCYWCWHLVKAVVLIPWRFIRFRRHNHEWYMTDFCYVNTYFCAMCCFIAMVRICTGYETILHTYGRQLFMVGFAFANGALSWSVPIFGNKIVFHDIDNTTGIFVHLSPAVMFWTLRWGGGFGTSLIESTWPTLFQICPDMYEDAAFQSWLSMLWSDGDCRGTFLDFLVLPSVCWVLFWGLPYYLIVLKCLGKYLEDEGKATLYSQTIKDKAGVGYLVTKAPERFWHECFLLQHFSFNVVSALLSLLFWNSFVAHTLFVNGVFVHAVHNGSTYIFRVVAAKHVQDKLELRKSSKEFRESARLSTRSRP